MSLPEPLLSMCRNTLIVEPFVSESTDGYGVITYSTSTTTYSARIVGKRQIVRNKEGHEVVSGAMIYVADDVQLDLRDRITLSTVPSGCSSQPQILSIAYYPDATSDGMSHTVVYV